MSAEAVAALAALSGWVAYECQAGASLTEVWIWDGRSSRYYTLDGAVSRESVHVPDDIEAFIQHNYRLLWKAMPVPDWFVGHASTYEH